MLMQTSSLIFCLFKVYSDELCAIRSQPHILSVIDIQSTPATFIEKPQRIDAADSLHYSEKLISAYSVKNLQLIQKLLEEIS